MLRAVLIAALVFTVFAHAEDAAELQKKGIAALTESQTNPRAIVEAARCFAKASAAYEAAGDVENAVEMNSYLYWCKKKMNLADIEAFTNGGDAAVAASLKAVDATAVTATEAQKWLERAEAFGRAKPNEHLLIAIRFYEVADRFKAVDLPASTTAMDRSLKEMQLVGSAAANALPPVNLKATAEAMTKVPIPDAAKLKEAEKQVKEVFKTEYASSNKDVRLGLSKKLLQYGLDTRDDMAAKYVQLREARDLAAAGGDAETAMQAADGICAQFETDACSERTVALQKSYDPACSKDAATITVRLALRAVDEAVAADQIGKIKGLLAIIDQAATRAGDAELNDAIKEKVKWLSELQREWPKVQAALEKLKAKPDDPAANKTVGTYWCLLKGDWQRGLPALARSSDAALKAIAEKELANPTEADKQAELGNLWWNLAEANTTTQKPQLAGRAREWYVKALPRLTGLEKAKIEKRVAALAPARTVAGNAVDLLALIDTKKDVLQGKWEVNGNELLSLEGSPARLQIPYQPPAEYNYKIVFTRQSGTDNIAQIMPKGRTQFAWTLAGHGGADAGFENINGKGRSENSTAVKIPIEAHKQYTSVVEVRNTGIKAFLDGKLVAEHKTDFKDMTPSMFKTKDQTLLGLATWGSKYVIHSIELVEVTGTGKAVRPGK